MGFDFVRFVNVFADRIGQRVAVEVRKRARAIVRVDTRELRNSIRVENLGNGVREVSSNTDYAAAQEYGRPDLPRYGFTPYMRPAAKEVNDDIGAYIEQEARRAANVARTG